MNIDDVLNKIKNMLLSFGLIEKQLGLYTNYVRGHSHCIPRYIDGLGFLIKYAKSEEDAIKYFHEDGDHFPIKLGEDAILAGIRTDIMNNVPYCGIVELGFNDDYYSNAITIFCKDGQKLIGKLDTCTSHFDNEPDGESIIIETAAGTLIEIYTDEIESIELL